MIMEKYEVLYSIYSIINHNFHNNYGHWQCMYLFLLACDKKLFYKFPY